MQLKAPRRRSADTLTAPLSPYALLRRTVKTPLLYSTVLLAALHIPAATTCQAQPPSPSAESTESEVSDQRAPNGEHSVFLPTWRMLTPEQKQQFIAGYLQGLRDAAKITDIAIDYVKQNPERSVEGLESIRGVYDARDLSPASVAHEVDRFFADPDHHSATLALAIDSARSNLR